MDRPFFVETAIELVKVDCGNNLSRVTPGTIEQVLSGIQLLYNAKVPPSEQELRMQTPSSTHHSFALLVRLM